MSVESKEKTSVPPNKLSSQKQVRYDQITNFVDIQVEKVFPHSFRNEVESRPFLEDQVLLFDLQLSKFISGYNDRLKITCACLSVKLNTAKSYIRRSKFPKKPFGGQKLIEEEITDFVQDFVEKKGDNFPTIEEVQEEIKEKKNIEFSKIQLKKHFINSNNNFVVKKAEIIEEKRKNIKKEDLEKYVIETKNVFNNTKQNLRGKSKKVAKLPPSRLLNIDESGFETFADMRSRSVIMPKKSSEKKPKIGAERTSKRITLVAGIWCDGSHTIPFLISSRKTIPNSLLNSIKLKKLIIKYQKRGFMNKDLFLIFLKEVVEPELIKRRNNKNDVFIILMDSFGSHITKETEKWAGENKVLFHTLCPHASHLSQPLDLLIFGMAKVCFFSFF